MRLRTKLTVVLALLVSTLAINVALSVWSIRFLEQELSLPLRSMQSVMFRLHKIEQAGEEEIALLLKLEIDHQEILMPDLIAVQEASAQISEIEARFNEMLDELEALPTVMLRSGVRTIENLRERSRRIEQANQTWLDAPDREVARALGVMIDDRHELIKRIEGRILEDSLLAGDFGDTLKARLYSIILVTLIGALAIGLVMTMFIRRWIFTPIEQLRAGAHRMAQGDFDHPIEVHSNDELGQLSGEFNRMGKLIVQMQEQRIEQERLAAMGEMAQRTVHNLRTPLAGIRALSETTLDELDPDSDLRDLQSRIISTVDRFEFWLKEMLRNSSPLELHLGELCPHTLVCSVIESHRAAAESSRIRIELIVHNPPSSAQGDPHHLEHAITAILSNAIEFAPTSSTIDVHLGGITENEQGYWTLRIANMGVMIPQSLHRTIFRPYFTTRQSGTGIGLAMSKRVIDQHHGLIEVESPIKGTQETGCAFTIHIPVHPERGAYD